MLKLEAQKRDVKINPEVIREEGKIPAVFYGAKVDSTPIAISASDFKKVWREAGESTIVTLSVDGKDVDTLVHDVAVDPVSEEPIHTDFYVIDKTKKVSVRVPLEFVGVSIAEKDLGGTLTKVFHEIEVEALPDNLPSSVEVDISALQELDTHISVKDLKVPEGVELKAPPEEVIVSITEQKEEVEEVPEEVDMESIEVEEKGKKDEEGEGEKQTEKKEGAPKKEEKDQSKQKGKDS